MSTRLILVFALLSFLSIANAQWNDPKVDSVDVGLTLYDNGDYEGALNFFNAALEYDAKFTDAWFYKAKCFHELKDYKRSIKLCDKVIKQQDHFMMDAYILKASNYNRLGDFDAVLDAYQKAIEKYPNSSLLYRKLGIRLLKRERIEEAKGYLINAVKLNPEDALSQKALSHTLFKNNEDLLGVMVLYKSLLLDRDDEDAVMLVDLLQSKIAQIINNGVVDGPVTFDHKKLKLTEEISVKSLKDMIRYSRAIFGNVETSNMEKDNFWWHYYVIFYQTLNVNSLMHSFVHHVCKEARPDEYGKYTMVESNVVKLEALATQLERYKWPKMLR